MLTRIPRSMCVAAACACAFLLSLSPELRAEEAPSSEPELVIPTPEERDRVLIGERKVAPETPRSMAEQSLLATQDQFDVTHYFLDLDFDEVLRRVTGSVTISATSLVDGLQHVVLDLHNFMVVSAVRRGSVVLSFSRNGQLIDVTLDTPADAGVPFEITVSYAGSPTSTGSYFGWNKYTSGAGSGQMVWSLSEPQGARVWWPCKDRPDDKATVEEWYTVKSGWTATGNGKLLGVDPVGSKLRYRWAPTHPLPTYLVSIAATDYVSFSHVYTPLAGGSMPVDYYVYSGTLASAQTSFSATPQMIGFYAQTFGEYPFVEDKYGMSAFPFSGAMEHSTNTSYGQTLINGSHQYDYVVAHELSHQWWGDSVSPETWADIWLNEGFASYCEALWAEHLGGASQYRSYMSSLYRSSFSGPVYNNASSFGTTVYNKGAWVQHMLRHVLGDQGFFQLLRGWHESRRDGNGNTAQYQATGEGVYGSSLGWFFGQWVYGQGMPTYQMGWKTADLGNGTFRNYVRVRQLQPGGVPYVMPVDLSLTGPSGTEVRSVWNDGIDQDFILDTTQAPSSIAFDPSNWILKTGVSSLVLADADSDGVPDRNDNCSAVANPQQTDTDGDLQGDACDGDDDGDLLPDAADCAPLDAAQGQPGEVVSLAVATPGSGVAELAWSEASRADSYQISRGRITELALGYGACLASGVVETSFSDPDAPDAGEGFLYLVRGVDSGCGGVGPAGVDSAGTPRSLPCP